MIFWRCFFGKGRSALPVRPREGGDQNRKASARGSWVPACAGTDGAGRSIQKGCAPGGRRNSDRDPMAKHVAQKARLKSKTKPKQIRAAPSGRAATIGAGAARSTGKRQ